jgi:hypothetical protein
MFYDELIIPVPSDAVEGQWRDEQGWETDKLDQFLEILGELAIPVSWDQTKWEAFKTRFAAAKMAAFDAKNLAEAKQTNLDPFYVTRMLLAQDFLPTTSKGVIAWPDSGLPIVQRLS